MWYGDGWGHMGGWTGAWGWVGMVLMLLFWFGLVALIIWAIVGSRPGRLPATGGPRGDHALTILRERYARGEITAEEFEQATRTLDETRP